jgi:hypothetical protein
VLSQNVEHLQNEITSFENSRQKGCFVYHTQAIAMECVASHFQQSLMESLPLEPCGKPESS